LEENARLQRKSIGAGRGNEGWKARLGPNEAIRLLVSVGWTEKDHWA